MTNKRSFGQGWQGSSRPRGRGGAPKAKIYTVAGLFLALVGAIIAWFFWPRSEPKPHSYSIVVDQYEDARIPPVEWAENDRGSLKEMQWESDGTFNSQQKNELLAEIKNLGHNRSSNQPIVVYLRAFAVNTGDGVAILPALASLRSDSSWLPLRDVLHSLKECQIPNKILLLDVTMPLIVPRAGFLLDDVSYELDRQLENHRDKDPNLHVISACEPGQVSYASEEMAQSTFMYFALRGLQGEADGIIEKKSPDGKVAVSELAAYLRGHTDTWARDNRGRRQLPVHYAGETAKDFVLSFAHHTPNPKKTTVPGSLPDFVLKGWKLRDEWVARLGRDVTADLVIGLDDLLLGSERRLRAGATVGSIRRRVNDRLDVLVERRERLRFQFDSGRARSIVAEVASGREPPEVDVRENLRALKELGKLAVATAVEKPNQADVDKLNAEKDKYLKPFLKDELLDKSEDLAWTIYKVATVDRTPSLISLKLWLSLLEYKGAGFPDLEEALYLQRLSRISSKEEDWPAAAIPEALELFGESMKARAIPKRWVRWIAELRDECDAARRNVERKLMSTTAAKVRDILPDLKAAAAKYRTLNTTVATLIEAQKQLDRGLIYLPRHVASIDYDRFDVNEWESGVRQTKAMKGLLEKPPARNELVAQIGTIRTNAGELERIIDSLQDPLRGSRFQQLIEASGRKGKADCEDMRHLLELVGLSGEERNQLWKSWRTVAADLHKRSLAKLDESRNARKKLDIPDWNQGHEMNKVYTRGRHRAEAMLQLLELYGAKNVDRVRAKVQAVKNNSSVYDEWRNLRDELALGWESLRKKD